MAVHQLLPRFHLAEPSALAAVELQILLRRLGQWGELYALEREEGSEALVQHADALRVRPADLVLLHHDRESPLAARLLHLPCQRGVVFHGLVPLGGVDADDSLRAARAQLTGLAEPGALGLGLSEFAASELRRMGWATVEAVPLYIEPERYGPDRADTVLRARLDATDLTVVAGARTTPGGGLEDLLRLHGELRRLRPDTRLLLLLLGTDEPLPPLARELRDVARHEAGVSWLGRLRHAERVAALRSASVAVSMDERDGSGLELLEAMAAGVPVLAYGGGAAVEALGGAGIAFTEKRFGVLAELVVRLATDHALRARLLAGQERRLRAQGPEASARRLATALASVGLGRAPRSPRTVRRPRVGLIVQRYGPGVTGGAEAHARQIVERLSPHWDLRVLTSCAVDHLSWANALPAGESEVEGVPVVRFPTPGPRPMHQLNALSRRLFGRSLSLPDEERWMALQGPLVPGLWRHLAEEGGGYDGFVAFTYLYVSTAWAVPLVGERLLLVPTAHEEEALQFDAYREVFERPAVLLVNSEEELALIHRRFPGHARARVVGVGVEAPPADGQRFRTRFGIDGPFLLYLGRVERGKGIPELLDLYARFRRSRPGAPALVLAGESSMAVEAEGVRVLGRIEEQEKWDGLSAAEAVVVPSAKESLSLLALEAFAVGTPVVGNAASAVVRGHLERSRAGAAYRDAASFAGAVTDAGSRREQLSVAARSYARQFSWARVVDAYREEMERLLRLG
jgi:glycosyltransferase involved in cell wall biosynthesis